jgi:hypothetical protein
MLWFCLAAAAFGPGCSQTDPVCGNDQLEGTEECDQTHLNDKGCADFGFDGGTLACTAQCAFDTSGCRNTPQDCANGEIDPGEDCDGAELAETTCADLGFLGGELACAAACSFDTSGCEVDPCGDGAITGEEECDGAELNDWGCQDFGFAGGALACNDRCRLDSAGCTGCTDDGLEENDSLAAAAPLATGVHALGLCSFGGEEDWFWLPLVTDDVLVVELVGADPFLDVDLELTDRDGLVLAASNALGPQEQIVYTASSDGDYALRVFLYGDAFGALEYSLAVKKNPACLAHADCPVGDVCDNHACVLFVCSPDQPCPDELACDLGSCVECASAADCPEPDAYTCDNNACIYDCNEDAYEPNSSKAEAAPIAVGFSEAGLTLCGDGDEDWFWLDLAALHAYDLALSFTHADGDIDVEVYAAADDASPVAAGYSFDDDERVPIPVGADGAGTYRIRVRQGPGELAQTYQLNLLDAGSIECAWDADCPTEGDICKDRSCLSPDCVEDTDCTAPERCADNLCVAPPVGDTCAAAIVVAAFPFTDENVDMGPHRNAVAFDQACTGWSTAGNDVVYQVALTAGQRLTATVSADFDAALVISSECSASPAAEACLAGADEFLEGGVEQVAYLAGSDQTVYLLVDTFTPLFPPAGRFTLSLAVE